MLNMLSMLNKISCSIYSICPHPLMFSCSIYSLTCYLVGTPIHGRSMDGQNKTEQRQLLRSSSAGAVSRREISMGIVSEAYAEYDRRGGGGQ